MPDSQNKIPPQEPSDAGWSNELRDWDFFDWSSSDEASEREGLPANYKMRHDAHYVDELLSANGVRQVIRLPVQAIAEALDEGSDVQPLADSIAEFGVLQPLIVRRHRGRYELVVGAKRLAAAKAAGLADVPCILYDVDDEQAHRIREATNLRSVDSDAKAMSDNRALLRAVVPLLGRSLHTIRTSLQLLGDSSGGRGDRVASDLIHVQRATRLAWGATLISSAPSLSLMDFDAADVLEEVLLVCKAERALVGLNLDKRIQGPCGLRADRRLVAVAMRGALDAILPLARSRQAATLVVILARHQPSRSVVLEVSQDALRPADSVWNRWFDVHWRDRPGGIASGVGLLAAKRVIEVHGGRLAISPRQGGGCRLALRFPEVTPAPGRSTDPDPPDPPQDKKIVER